MSERVTVGISLENFVTVGIMAAGVLLIIVGIRKFFPGTVATVTSNIKAATVE